MVFLKAGPMHGANSALYLAKTIVPLANQFPGNLQCCAHRRTAKYCTSWTRILGVRGVFVGYLSTAKRSQYYNDERSEDTQASSWRIDA